MSITERCDEIIRLIDEVLGESPSETDVRRRPPPARLQTAAGISRMRPQLTPVEH